jgi:hypothetical protein
MTSLDPYLDNARARYHAGEPLVTAWMCPDCEWFMREEDDHERCPGYDCNRRMVPRRGLWGECAEFEGAGSWFYGYHVLRAREGVT